MADIIRMTFRIEGQECELKVRGRYAWTLGKLLDAGDRGVTPIERPAPRWSEYVHGLRRAGVDIETIDERHDGPYRGRHGRYVLRSRIVIVESEGAQ